MIRMPFPVQFIFISIITVLSATTVAAPTINVQADKASYAIGDQVILSITLSDSPVIYGGGLDITFNPAVVSANYVQVNPLWDFTIKEGIIDNTAGMINDIFFTHFSGLSGNIAVATIVLDTIAAGSTGISVTESPAKQFTDTDGKNVVFTTNNLASGVLVNTTEEADQIDTDQTTGEESATEQTISDQSENQQTTTDSGVFIPAERSSGNREPSDTIENDWQRETNTFVSNRQQGDTAAGLPNNMDNQSTTGLTAGPENNYKEGSYNTYTQTLPVIEENPGATTSTSTSTDRKKAETSPGLLITFAILILAFIGYRMFVSRRK